MSVFKKYEDLTIRSVQQMDLPGLIELCAAHAAYEQLPFALDGQAARLAKDLWNAKPKLFCLVAEKRQTLIAYATYMPQYATWEAGEYLYLDCLFVDGEYRSQGIGEKLMEQVKLEALRLHCHLIQWQTPDFNKKAIKFYKRLGAFSKTKERFFLVT